MLAGPISPLGCRQPPARCVLVWRESRRLGGLNEDANPITGLHPDDLISLSSPPKGPASKQHHSGFRASAQELKGGHSLQQRRECPVQTSRTGVPTAFCPALKGVAVRGTPGRTLLGKQCSLPVASTTARVSLARPQPDGVQRPLPAQPGPQPCDGASRVPSAGQRGSPADPCGQLSCAASSLPAARASQQAEGQEASRG